MQKGNNRGQAQRGNNVDFGDFAMQCLEPGRLTSRQIEACRPWLHAEILVIEPDVVVCLGATAAPLHHSAAFVRR